MLGKVVFLLILCSEVYSNYQYGCLLPTKHGLALGTCPYRGHNGTCPTPLDCGFQYPKRYSIEYECYIDFDCTADHKCCKHPCFQHSVCLKATNSTKTQ